MIPIAPPRRLARIAAAALAFTMIPAWAATHEKTLANGLKVIVKEDHRSPVLVQQVWYRTGSMDETAGVSGVAHVLEHMMFKGTKSVPAGEFSRRIAAAGGRENAFTGHDYTAYFQQLHKSQLPLAMKLESDRMSNLVMSEAEFAKEIKVVMEERRWRTDDNPKSLLGEQLNAVAFSAHPYRRPIVGWMNDLENMKASDALAWYKRWYAPNNAVLVVAGDVDPKQVFALAERHYGKARPSKLPERKPQEEPAQTGQKRVVVKAPAELPYVTLGWKVPALRDVRRDWEPYALEVLAGVLDGNESARLNSRLVREKQLAISAGAGYDGIGRGPGMFLLDGTPAQGKSVADLEAALKAEIRDIAENGVKPDELERVKAQVRAAQVYERDSVFYQAMQIGQLEMSGLSYKDLDLLVEKVGQVTAEQVQAVARKYFGDDQLTAATLDPQPLDGKRPAAPPSGARHLR